MQYVLIMASQKFLRGHFCYLAYMRRKIVELYDNRQSLFAPSKINFYICGRNRMVADIFGESVLAFYPWLEIWKISITTGKAMLSLSSIWCVRLICRYALGVCGGVLSICGDCVSWLSVGID